MKKPPLSEATSELVMGLEPTSESLVAAVPDGVLYDPVDPSNTHRNHLERASGLRNIDGVPVPSRIIWVIHAGYP